MCAAPIIGPGLWESVRHTYEAGNYTHAILDAIQYLSGVLRERALVDGDGVALVNQALGGDEPRLRLNRLQTVTEKDVQLGFAHLLRGIYLGIRNPRSHEQVRDDKATADAVISFLGYLLRVVGESEQAWSIERFLHRVLDQDFVPSERYARILVSEIPAEKRSDALIHVFRARAHANLENLRWVTHALLSLQDDTEQAEFMAAVSQEYEDIELSYSSVRSLLKLLRPELWKRMSDAARLRVENKVVREITEGRYDPDPRSGECTGGALATWATDYFTYFDNPRSVCDALRCRLGSHDSEERAYVARFFLSSLAETAGDKLRQMQSIQTLSDAILRKGDAYVKERVAATFWPDEWLSPLRQSLAELEDTEPDYYRSLGGIPF